MTDIEARINETLDEIKSAVDAVDVPTVVRAAKLLLEANVIVTFGNGGSYATASHLVGDLLLRTRAGCFVKSIGDNLTMHTACNNDFSWEEAAAIELNRLCTAPGPGVVVLFSTSGESKNVVRMAKQARQMNYKVIAIFGCHLNRIEPYADVVFKVDGTKSGRIEAVHSAICHAIAEAIRGLSGEAD